MNLKQSIVADKLDGKLVLLDTERNIFVELNEVGGSIVEIIKNGSCNGVNDIIDLLKSEYQIDDFDVKADVMEFIDNLIKEGIVIK